MEGKRVEVIFNYIDKFSKEILFIQIGFLLIIFAVFIWVWLYNRRRFHHLKHQIPASVVKNYLDSIIQNSTALKSSLFRGGGMDLEGGIPSVMPLKDMAGGSSSIIIGSGDESEEINAKNAEIMKLRAELEQKQNVVRDLEKEMIGLKGEVKSRDERIIELENEIKNLKGNLSGEGTALSDELESTKSERDELRNRLAEYAVIEDDLANLKRLQQENDQLRSALNSKDDLSNFLEEEEAVAEVATEEVQETEDFPEALESNDGFEDDLRAMEEALEESEKQTETESFLADEPTEVEAEVEEVASEEEEVVAAASEEKEEEEKESSEKTPEDLLSEFEKMLG